MTLKPTRTKWLEKIPTFKYNLFMESFKIKIYRKLIDYYNYCIKCLKKKIEKLWIEPDCTKCLRNDSPCVPSPWECSGFVEKKNGRQKNY